MPNHVTNIIRIIDLGGRSKDEISAVLLDSEGRVDFNGLIPMPECLRGESPHSGIVDRAKMALGIFKPHNNDVIANLEIHNLLKFLNQPLRDEDLEDLIKAIRAGAECGYVYWYDWACEHWGVKWNAYGQPDDGYAPDWEEVTFQTAWSHPEIIVTALSNKFPEVEFFVQYADEDTGSNCGKYLIKNGVVYDSDIAPSWADMNDQEKRQYTEFAFGITNPGEDPRSHGYDENWEYHEEIYEEYEAAQG